jgi:hypothetical protein
MPDRRRHRGPHPGDGERFAADRLPVLRAACADFAWLLDRGYAERSALKLVGDRFQLDQRQRMCVQRCACTEEARGKRASRLLPPHALAGASILVDGFNVLITVEAALAGAVLLLGRDGCLRDLASMHGTWRTVDETADAAARIGAWLAHHGVAGATWLLDRPVANSGRLAALLRSVAAEQGFSWQVAVCDSPDRELRSAAVPVATADSAVLDRCGAWLNLARDVVEASVGAAWILDLGTAH